MSTRNSEAEVVNTDIVLTSMWYSTIPRYLTTAPGSPTTHWYQIRCVLSQPLYVLAGQSITGRLHLIAHSSQSYTIHLTMSGRWSLPLCLLFSPAFYFDIFLVLLAPKDLNLSMHKNMYLSYMLFIFSWLCQKRPYLKSTHYSNALFKMVQYLNVIEDLGSNTQPRRPWMQLHTHIGMSMFFVSFWHMIMHHIKLSTHDYNTDGFKTRWGW